jgi:hypothetical protein
VAGVLVRRSAGSEAATWSTPLSLRRLGVDHGDAPGVCRFDAEAPARRWFGGEDATQPMSQPLRRLDVGAEPNQGFAGPRPKHRFAGALVAELLPGRYRGRQGSLALATVMLQGFADSMPKRRFAGGLAAKTRPSRCRGRFGGLALARSRTKGLLVRVRSTGSPARWPQSCYPVDALATWLAWCGRWRCEAPACGGWTKSGSPQWAEPSGCLQARGAGNSTSGTAGTGAAGSFALCSWGELARLN